MWHHSASIRCGITVLLSDLACSRSWSPRRKAPKRKFLVCKYIVIFCLKQALNLIFFAVWKILKYIFEHLCVISNLELFITWRRERVLERFLCWPDPLELLLVWWFSNYYLKKLFVKFSYFNLLSFITLVHSGGSREDKIYVLEGRWLQRGYWFTESALFLQPPHNLSLPFAANQLQDLQMNRCFLCRCCKYFLNTQKGSKKSQPNICR